MSLLKFGKGNAKLGKNVYTFSLPSGFTCPGAKDCLSKSNRITGKITDGPDTEFRCFSASQEALYKNVREQRWYNFELLKEANKLGGDDEGGVNALLMLITASIPKKANIIRIHVGGDFYNQNYFDAWMWAAQSNPKKTFYFYTKSLNSWINRLDYVGRGDKPGTIANFVPTASFGGRYDDLIAQYKLRYAKVVYTEKEARTLEIDHDDTHAMKHGKSFALLLHGTQPKGSEASSALQLLKKDGKGGYSKKIALPTI